MVMRRQQIVIFFLNCSMISHFGAIVRKTREKVNSVAPHSFCKAENISCFCFGLSGKPLCYMPPLCL